MEEELNASLFGALDRISNIEVETRDNEVSNYKYTVEEAKQILIDKIKEKKGKKELFDLLSQSLCFLLRNVKYNEDEL